MKRIAFSGAIVILLAIGLMGDLPPVFAQAGGPYALAWSSIDASGGNSAGGAYGLVSTIGQAEAGATQSGGAYTLNGGVVDAGASGEPTPGGRQVFLPLIMR